MHNKAVKDFIRRQFLVSVKRERLEGADGKRVADVRLAACVAG
jgi:hypothetical protein